MLQSYDQEIREKRRSARIFWYIVCIFAIFLFFFFQGYYPSIRIGLETIGQVRTLSGEKNYTDIIQSFGIVNVQSFPSDATILFESGSYGNDEKRMVRYGAYQMDIAKVGYFPIDLSFTIEKDMPYFIELAHLLPRPIYREWSGTGQTFSRIDGRSYLAQSGSISGIYDGSFSGMIMLGTGRGIPIGEGYILSGSGLSQIDTLRYTIDPVEWSGLSLFMDTCRDSISVRYGHLICRENNSLLQRNGKRISGVKAYGDGYVLTESGLLIDTLSRPLALTGIIAHSTTFISYDYSWYGLSGAVLVPIDKDPSQVRIDTGLDQVEYITNAGGTLYAIGMIGTETRLSIIEGGQKRQKRMIIPFPRVDLTDIRLERKDGNTFFKMRSNLLFLAHNSQKIQWIIDGEIIAFLPDGALYRSNGKIWHADWREIVSR